MHEDGQEFDPRTIRQLDHSTNFVDHWGDIVSAHCDRYSVLNAVDEDVENGVEIDEVTPKQTKIRFRGCGKIGENGFQSFLMAAAGAARRLRVVVEEAATIAALASSSSCACHCVNDMRDIGE